MYYKGHIVDALREYENKDSYSKTDEKRATQLAEVVGINKPLPPLELARIRAFCDCLPFAIIKYIKHIY